MVNGSHVAARVSRTHGRPFLFNDPPEERPQPPTLPVPNEEKGKGNFSTKQKKNEAKFCGKWGRLFLKNYFNINAD